MEERNVVAPYPLKVIGKNEESLFPTDPTAFKFGRQFIDAAVAIWRIEWKKD